MDIVTRARRMQASIDDLGAGPRLTVDDYAEAAMRTSSLTRAKTFSDPEVGVLIAALGLAGEAGEFADHVKKWVAQGHELDYDKLDAEAGDVAWYLARYAEARGIPLSDIFKQNIRKLEARYGGRFSPEKSRNR